MEFRIPNLWKAAAGEEALPNPVKGGSPPSPYSRRTPTPTKPRGIGSNGSVLSLVFAGGAFVVGAIVTRQVLFWCMDQPKKSNLFIMQESKVNPFLRGEEISKEEEDMDRVVVWEELPLELWDDIGRRLVSRLDVLRFRSVCKRWRLSLSSPNRFPLQVPRTPRASGSQFSKDVPYFIAETNIYSVGPAHSRSVQRVLVKFVELDQGGKFYPLALVPKGVEFDLPTILHTSLDSEQQLSRLSFVAKTFSIFRAIPPFDSLNKRGEGKWNFGNTSMEVRKVILITSNVIGFDARYAPASDLSAVVLMHERNLALLRLGESQDPRWGWNTDFCSGVFEDIVVYRGQLCTLDRMGRAFLMDYDSLEMTLVAASLSTNHHGYAASLSTNHHRYASWKQLFVSCGDLYLVTFLVEVVNELALPKVYKLDMHLKRWCEVDNTGNHCFLWEFSNHISIPRDVLDATYGSWMMKCKGDGSFFTPSTLLVMHEHGGRAYCCFLGFTEKHYIPWHPMRGLDQVVSSSTTTTSSILSQYENSIVGRTNYLECLSAMMITFFVLCVYL